MIPKKCISVNIEGQRLFLHPYKAMYWSEESMLVVSDLHLGKIAHFRRAGIYLPDHASMDNYERLSSLLLEFEPKSLLLLGDLFHSQLNNDWKYFSDLRQTFRHVDVILVLGNHDILEEEIFRKNDVAIMDRKQVGPFLFTHHPLDHPTGYNIAGHIHPGVRLVGDAKQTLRLPCFYFRRKQAILPAFGTFTGISLVYPRPEDQVFVISEEELIDVSTPVD